MTSRKGLAGNIEKLLEIKDKEIAELKKENELLKSQLHQAMNYTESYYQKFSAARPRED